ncbi:MAG: exosortase H [Halioglobus sp.]|nr:exosortase H [Halioglobus sp.]
MTRFVLIFLFILLSLFTLEMLVPVQEHVIVPFTALLAKLSAAIILPFDDTVLAYGKILQFRDTGFAVSIEAGCNGVEATIVLIAAVVAFPATWKARMLAIGLGFIAIQVLNIARIISLFYLGNWNMDFFSWIHLYLWPALIMLDVLIVFIVYLRYLDNAEGMESAEAVNG